MDFSRDIPRLPIIAILQLTNHTYMPLNYQNTQIIHRDRKGLNGKIAFPEGRSFPI